MWEIQSRYRNGIWHRKMRHDNNEKWQMTHNGRSRTTKSNSNQNTWGKRNLQILGDIGSWYHQTSGNERKNFKSFSEETENYSRQNHIKAKIDKTQQNSRCWLCGDRDETINHIISECSKLPHKEYKTRHNWVGKVIHWELCKKLSEFHWELCKKLSESVLENKTHKLLWDFDIQMNHLI